MSVPYMPQPDELDVNIVEVFDDETLKLLDACEVDGHYAVKMPPPEFVKDFASAYTNDDPDDADDVDACGGDVAFVT